MRRSAPVLLADAIEAVDSIATITAGLSVDEYRGSRLHRAAVERELLIIGEALGALRSADPALADRIPDLRRVVGLRNRLAHAYDVIDDGIVFGVATTDVPRLRSTLAALLDDTTR